MLRNSPSALDVPATRYSPEKKERSKIQVDVTEQSFDFDLNVKCLDDLYVKPRTMEIYDTGDVAHEADFSNPLEHGVVRFIPCADCPVHVRNQLPSKNDRKFVYVPVGYLRRERGAYMDQILAALGLPLPNIVVVTPETAGSAEEQRAESYGVSDAASHPIASDWSEGHCREVLAAKIGGLLGAVMESSAEVGAWVLPDCPRRRNGAATTVCEALPAKCVALGLIGLDEEAEDVEFEAALREAMVPVGSPAKSAVRLSFDPNLSDGAPLPQLTHLLIFESPEEKTIFRNKLLDLVPDFMVAFGNVTREAMNNIFESVKAGSPIVLIQHSGPNIIKMSKMFRHIHSHLGKDADPPQNSAGRAKSIPPLSGEDDDLIRLFINTWPAGYNRESVVLADPLVTTGAKLQKRLLDAISACFDLKTGGADARAVRRRALGYAWAFHATADAHSRQKKGSTESLHVQFVIFTLLSIVASVIYSKIYGGMAPSGTVQTTIYVSTILLPLYVTSLKQDVDKGTAMANWGAFKVASFQIYSEILKFRTQSGRYRVEEKTEIALQKPVEAFTLRIKEIWMSLKPFLHEDSIMLPEDFWNNSGISDVSSPDTIVSDLLELPPVPPDETTPILPPCPPILASDPSEKSPPNDFDDEDPPEVEFVDDNYSPLKADDYITCRMQVQMQAKADRLEKMVARNNLLGLAIRMITIFSGGCAAMHLQWFVPIILAVTAALGTAQDYRKYPHRIEKGNDMVVRLNEMKLWWMGLSMYEKQLPQNKDNLILTSERIIVSELQSSYGGQSSSESKDD